MKNRGTVYVVDDDVIIRKSIGLILKSAGFAPHPFASGADFLQALDYLESGCVLLDMHMPAITGMDVQDKLLELGNNMPIVIMTGAGNVSMAVKTIKRGAVDFIEKPINETLLIRTLEEAFSLLEKNRSKDEAAKRARARIDLLSAREVEVLKFLAVGKLNKEIAFDIGLSVRTVEMHRANLMHKLGIHTVAEACREVQQTFILTD
jgi:two-component system response regulator FixJ